MLILDISRGQWEIARDDFSITAFGLQENVRRNDFVSWICHLP